MARAVSRARELLIELIRERKEEMRDLLGGFHLIVVSTISVREREAINLLRVSDEVSPRDKTEI